MYNTSKKFGRGGCAQPPKSKYTSYATDRYEQPVLKFSEEIQLQHLFGTLLKFVATVENLPSFPGQRVLVTNSESIGSLKFI